MKNLLLIVPLAAVALLLVFLVNRTARTAAAAVDVQANIGRPATRPATENLPPVGKIEKTDAEWKKELTDKQFYILRQSGTEKPFSSELLKVHQPGTFVCAACGNPLYAESTKFESGTGWPSFYEPLPGGRVGVAQDNSLGMSRDEVFCARCGGHLGHVFRDGPAPTGLRYCMDGDAMKFVPAKDQPSTKPAR